MIHSDIRVMQLSAAYFGAQKQIEDAIHNRLDAAGINNKVLYMVGNAEGADYIGCERKLEGYIRRFCYKYISKSHRFSRIQTRRLIREIEQFKPDIFHIHSIHHGYVDFPALFDYLGKKKIKVVYTVHDMWPFTGGCYHFTEIECEGYLHGCETCRDLLDRHDCEISQAGKTYDLKRRSYEILDKVCFVSVSRWVNQQLENSSLKKYEHCIIPNCIVPTQTDSKDLPLFQEKIQKAIEGKYVLVFVASSWDKAKGYDTVCSLARQLGEKYILIIVGNTSNTIKDSVPANMYFTGYLNDKACLQYLYKIANLHVSASKEETFGMTFVESAFEGTRSVGYAETAIKETIQSVGGYCANADEKDSLLHSIMAHVSEGKMSNIEIETIKKYYSEETMADKYLSVYENLLSI